MYHATKEFIEPLFKKFGSENLIKDMALCLDQKLYLPGDYIIRKDDLGEEMYFVAEGTVFIIPR